MPRVSMLGGRRIEQYNSPNGGGKMDAHHGTVLHIAQGTYRGTIAWQMNPDQRYASGGSVTTCSTWIVGREPGEWAQMMDSDRIAWCQRGGSRTWNSIELAGYAPNPPTEWQIWACAQILVWQHRTHGDPLAIADHPGERGLGHHSMDREWIGEEWGHDACPGSGVIKAKGVIVARARAILAGEDDDMTPDQVQDEVRKGVHGLLDEAARRSTSTGRQVGDDLAVIIDRRLDAKLAPVLTNLAGLAGRDWVDEQQIVDGVLAGLGGKDLDEAAEALRAAFGDDRAAELGALLVATGGTAGTGSA